jgi:hypothetical protein
MVSFIPRAAQPLASFLAAQTRQRVSSIFPSSKESILENLGSAAPRMAELGGSKGSGFTYDPRTNRFLNPGEDIGAMMASQKNLADQLGGAGTASSAEEILSVLSQTRNLERLRRGEYVGGWNPEGTGIGLDTSRRFSTQLGALMSGRPTNQLAGFNLRSSEEFPVSGNLAFLQALGGVSPTRAGQIGFIPRGGMDRALRGANIGALTGAASGSVVGGAGAAAAALEDDEISANDIAAILGGGALGAVGGRALGTRIGAGASGVSQRGVLDPGVLSSLRKAGVPESAMGGIGMAGMVAKARAASIGVPEKELLDIADYADEATAFSKAYEAARVSAAKPFNKMSTAEVAAARESLKNSPGVTVDDDAVLPVSIRRAYSKSKTTKSSYAPGEISEDLADMGVRPVRHAGKPSELANLSKNGEVEKLIDAMSDIQHNFLQFITPEDLAGIASRGGVPIFYVLHNLFTRARAAIMGAPVLRLNIEQGVGSARSGPITESVFTSAAEFGKQLERIAKKSGRVAPPFVKGDTASNAARAAAIRSGSMINLPSMAKKTRDIMKAAEDVEDDIIAFAKNPLSVKGIKEKVWTYLGTMSSPLQKISSTIDSWMVRAAFGNTKLSTAATSRQYELIHSALNDLARRLGVPPAALQEIIWKNVRIGKGKALEDSFLPLLSRRYEYPTLSASFKGDPGIPSVTTLATRKEYKDRNARFAAKLLQAIEEDPSIIRFFEIAGDDIQFTDEFLRAVGGSL